MFKRRWISGLVFFAIWLVVMSLVTGCARRTLVVAETIKDPSVRMPLGQAEGAQKVKEVPIKPAPEITKVPPVDQLPALTVREPVKPVLAVPAIKEEPLREEPVKPQKIRLTMIHFEFDMYSLTTEAKAILGDHARRLLKLSDFSLLIEGHCDERGTQEYNLALGERRAASAMKYLIALGVNEKNIRTISYGEEVPFDPQSNEEAWARNRRAEFILTMK